MVDGEKKGEKLLVKGGTKLEGTVSISGAKNSALPILAASLLTEETVTIHDVPSLRDVFVMKEILQFLGAKVETGKQSLRISTASLRVNEIPGHLMRQMRASFLLMGPLLTRFKKIGVSLPGGCAIGPRPINLHLKGLEALGTKITEKHGIIEAEAEELKGAEIQLDFPSVGATENIMMASVLAKGTTIIGNAAKEPEIIDLQNHLNKMGAKIKGAGLGTIKIEGVETLHSAGHRIIPDRIEAGTFMVGAAITGGSLSLQNVIPEHLTPVTAKLKEAGATIVEEEDKLCVYGPEEIKPVDVKTLPYPGLPTDMQPQLMALLSLAKGTSVITETVFEKRFNHVDELLRMGADIKVEDCTAVIKGVPFLSGTEVEATDLRSGAALILAGLAAKGTTEVGQVFHIDRGYEAFETKLRSLGAKIERR